MPSSAASRFFRLCFVVLFAAMSLMHGPVMAYSGAYHTGEHHTGMSHHDHGHQGHRDPARPDKPASCTGFACFIAVEPMPVSVRPLHAAMIGVLRFDPASELHAAAARPNLPPPRLRI